MSLIEVKNLSFKYKEKEVISDLSFKVEKGDFLAIVGPNGSGKTTLMKLFAGLNKSHNKINIKNVTLNDTSKNKIRKKCGFIFSNPSDTFVGQTVRDDIEFGLKNLGLEKKEIEKRVKSFSKLLKLEKVIDKAVTKLSGGEKQKAALASVLAMGAEIIFFDDALSMVDTTEKNKIIKLLKDLKKELKLTYIYFTSNLEEIVDTDKVVVLDRGVKIIEGATAEILKQEEIFKSLGMNLPFLTDLSIKLGHYGLVDKIYDKEKELVCDIWE